MSEEKTRVLIDTNIALTYISGRNDAFSDSVTEVMRLCAEGNKIYGFIAFHSLPTIWYVIRKFPYETKREWIRQLCTLLTVVSAKHFQVLEAIEDTNFRDFEDCLQDKCAISASCDYIVTANISDFTNSNIFAVLPNVFLQNFHLDRPSEG